MWLSEGKPFLGSLSSVFALATTQELPSHKLGFLMNSYGHLELELLCSPYRNIPMVKQR